MPKIAQATAHLHSSHMLAKQGSKSSKHAQARLQEYVNCELPDVQTGFRKGKGTRDQIANICWIMKKAREFQKDIYFCYIDYAKPLTVWITVNWKILQRWEYQTTWPASWEISMKLKKQELELDMEQQIGSKLGKEYVMTVYFHPAYLTYMQSTSWKCRAGWSTSWNQDCQKKYQWLQICRWHRPYGRKWRGIKILLMKVKQESEKVCLKFNIQKSKMMASEPITSWQIDGETKKTVTDFIFLGSKIIADGDCSHEIKRRLLLGRKVMTNLDSTLKSKDITLPTKVHLVKAMIFPVVMDECDIWTIKKPERWTIDVFEL